MAGAMAVNVPVCSGVSITRVNARGQVCGSVRSGLRNSCAEWARRTVSNANQLKTRQMLVWSPFDMKKYETFSYLPALSDGEISRQVDYITRNGWVPCLEFSEAAQAYVSSENCDRMGSVTANYFDNRYWTMWKLPMFGCSDPGQVLAEVQNCRKAFPSAYSRLVAFDPIRQVQICSFVVNHPEMGNKKSFGGEVSNGISTSSSSSSSSYSSSSYSSSWDTSATKTNDWTYDWNKNDTSNSSSSWDTGKKDDWSYDWNKSSEPAAATSSWDTGKKDDWTYDWSKKETASSSWDTPSTKTNDWSYDWNKSADTSSTSWDSGSKTNDWSSSSATNNTWDTGKKDDWTYDWSKREDTSTTSSWDTGKKDDYTYDWSKRDDSSSSSWNSTPSYTTSSNGSTNYERKALVQEVIDVAKTVRDLEIKYAEVDVAGTKRLHSERRAELDKLLSEKDRWDRTEKFHIKQQMQECQQQITDLQRKIQEVQQMMQSRDAKFAVQIAACERDLATAEAAMAKVKELERQFTEKEAKLESLTQRICQ